MQAQTDLTAQFIALLTADQIPSSALAATFGHTLDTCLIRFFKGHLVK